MRLPGGETTSRGLACSASLTEPWSDTCLLSSPSVSGRLVSADFPLPNLLPMVFACLPGSKAFSGRRQTSPTQISFHAHAQSHCIVTYQTTTCGKTTALRRKQDLDMRPDPSTRARALSSRHNTRLCSRSLLLLEGSIHSYGLCGHCDHVGFEFCMCLHCDPMPYPLLGQL